MYNRAILIGRLVADPEMRTTPNGITVTRFRIAVDRPYTAKGAEKKADFITCVAWRQQGEFVSRYFSKGKAIGVEGSIQTDNYTDKEGNKRFSVEVVADRTFFVESKTASGGGNGGMAAPTYGTPDSQQGNSYASGSAADFQVMDNDDDLPF